MYDDSHEDPHETPNESALDPLAAAKDKFDEFRMHAELAAVFEGRRKFDAQMDTKLDGSIAREAQKTVARLEKSRLNDTPIVKPQQMDEARALLELPLTQKITTNDYHIHRRPGEAMILRWLAGDEVNSFYERFQAHFDAALKQFREEERQAKGWQQDEKTIKYLDALDAIDVKMTDRYLRKEIRQHRFIALSTQAADEMDIIHLSDYLMGVDAAQVVGRASAPPEDQPTERDRAWFFKLFSLRGLTQELERIFFFTYLQKSDDEEEEW